ncbi:ABC transporter substrate-binding protein [Alkalicoccobacillus murimartini]|uniref:NitT/TauT family transport system substrate-binding protein n=1 Tax=Alkalicoccobacillus murimartini TaxID=171685 RepID=A0ABT9YHL6_9BACI|nr:ABC transporter substrate-binding protein [Alkalicoccobacillus murimartini]MDQ0207355.1 NitT/TauT family transport system substrate-binding protein [Alkalicoccobacillus murimartini]
MRKSLLILCTSMILMILSACGSSSSQGASAEPEGDIPKLIVAEPLRGFGYLPLYVAIKEGFFEGVEVEITTLSGGSAHTNAVLTNEAWAFIGGPEHNAFAKAKNADLKAIVNVVNRGNVYMVAKDGLEVDQDMATFLKGKTIVTNPYGATPNSITRYLLSEWGLDVDKDVTLLEVDQSSIPSVISEGEGEVAIVADPILQQGINEGIWGEPIYNVPQELGDYAYSTMNVQLETIEEHPEQVEAFVEGMKKGLAFIRDNPEEALETATEEFSTIDDDLLEAMMQRALDDEHWEFSGEITEDSISTNLKVVVNADMLEADAVSYDDIVESSFFQK